MHNIGTNPNENSPPTTEKAVSGVNPATHNLARTSTQGASAP